MSETPTPGNDPDPAPPEDWRPLLFGLVGILMLLPGMCAAIGIYQNPGVVLPHSNVAPFFWLSLAIGVGGVALLWRARSRSK